MGTEVCVGAGREAGRTDKLKDLESQSGHSGDSWQDPQRQSLWESELQFPFTWNEASLPNSSSLGCFRKAFGPWGPGAGHGGKERQMGRAQTNKKCMPTCPQT